MPREVRRDDEPGDDHRADGDERRDARPRLVRRQLVPTTAEQLERVPEARLRRLLVERLVDVGREERLDRRRELLQLAFGRLDLARERELRRELRNASAGSPITTTSFGCTMCSSRRRNGRDSSSSPSANFRQFVP